jgi:DNA-binding transcriptional ArsR family regulator
VPTGPQLAPVPDDAWGRRADAVLDALGDPTRRRILALLAGAEQPVGALTEALGTVSQPAVSQHLRVLREAGLVAVRAEGTRRLHRLDPGGVAAAQGWLAALVDPLAGMARPLDALATEVARGRRARRTRRAGTAERSAG